MKIVTPIRHLPAVTIRRDQTASVTQCPSVAVNTLRASHYDVDTHRSVARAKSTAAMTPLTPIDGLPPSPFDATVKSLSPNEQLSRQPAGARPEHECHPYVICRASAFQS
jgi:hypothetical protein